MMVETTHAAPKRGTYVEIRRGLLIIIGRVMWSHEKRFGLRSQDLIDIEAIISPSSQPSNAEHSAGGDRRRDPSRGLTLETEARSRQFALLFQYAVFAGAAIAAAITAAALVGDVLSRPLQTLSKALGS